MKWSWKAGAVSGVAGPAPHIQRSAGVRRAAGASEAVEEEDRRVQVRHVVQPRNERAQT